MWDRLRKHIAGELQQLHLLLDLHRPLLEKCETTQPSPVELSALAAVLHSFYNGIENIFKRVAEELDGEFPRSEFWHKILLDAMAQATVRRSPVVSSGLRQRLKEYMEFRHVFRHAYTFSLRWERMQALVLGCGETLKLLEEELDRFFGAGTSSRG